MHSDPPTPEDVAGGLLEMFEEFDMDPLDALIFIKDLEDELEILRHQIEEEIAFG